MRLEERELSTDEPSHGLCAEVNLDEEAERFACRAIFKKDADIRDEVEERCMALAGQVYVGCKRHEAVAGAGTASEGNMKSNLVHPREVIELLRQTGHDTEGVRVEVEGDENLLTAEGCKRVEVVARSVGREAREVAMAVELAKAIVRGRTRAKERPCKVPRA